MAGHDCFQQVTPCPHRRVVGFCAKSGGDVATDSISTSSHSTLESPLSQMLRSATWPCLKVRLGRCEISQPVPLASQTPCSSSQQISTHACATMRHSVSSSPISIPRTCRLVSCHDHTHTVFKHPAYFPYKFAPTFNAYVQLDARYQLQTRDLYLFPCRQCVSLDAGCWPNDRLTAGL